MKLGVGVLFVAIGLVILWAAVTGRLSRLPAAWSALKGDDAASSGAAAAPASNNNAARIAAALNVPAGFPSFPVLPSFN